MSWRKYRFRQFLDDVTDEDSRFIGGRARFGATSGIGVVVFDAQSDSGIFPCHGLDKILALADAPE
jgi:hypothetical protein